jgi:hypothetical protein
MTLFRISKDKLEELQASPSYDSPLHELYSLYWRSKPGPEKQLLLFDDPDLSNPLSDWKLYLDKTWYPLHFLLTGEPEGVPGPISRAISGGTEIGRDLQFGPAKYLMPDEVREVSAALSAITHEELRRRFDPADPRAELIYFPMDDPEEEERFFNELVTYFDQLSIFYREAAKRNQAILIGIT